jgi:hypothetical protein
LSPLPPLSPLPLVVGAPVTARDGSRGPEKDTGGDDSNVAEDDDNDLRAGRIIRIVVPGLSSRSAGPDDDDDDDPTISMDAAAFGEKRLFVA